MSRERQYFHTQYVNMAAMKVRWPTRKNVTAAHLEWVGSCSDISSVISVNVEKADGTSSTMGIAKAEALRHPPDESVGKASCEAIRKACLPNQETCAAALNAITGWQLDL